MNNWEVYRVRYALLDHWRGVAALLVVGFHGLWATDIEGWATQNSFLRPIRWIFSEGWIGVHLFFVISGYCIAACMMQSVACERSAGQFLRDRLLRIYPPYWGALAFSFAVSIALSPFSNVGVVGFPPDFATVAADAALLFPYTGTSSGLIVSWTLVIEVGFYLAAGVGLALWRATRSKKLCLGAVVLFTSASFIPLPQPHFQVLHYWPEFLCGALVFFINWQSLRGQRAAALWCLAAICALSLLGLIIRAFMPSTLWLAGAFALVLAGLLPYERRLANLTPLRWLGYLGLISYSIYLIHSPVIVRVANLGKRLVERDSVGVLLVHGMMWGVSIGSACLFYYLLEAPWERWRRKFRRPANAAVSEFASTT